jgi:hypothetical protein
VLTKNVKKLIVDASSKCANKESQRKSSRMPLLVGKKIRHIFQEDSYVGKVISVFLGSLNSIISFMIVSWTVQEMIVSWPVQEMFVKLQPSTLIACLMIIGPKNWKLFLRWYV